MTDRIRIYEVGPRDGLQNEPGVIPMAGRLESVDMIVHRHEMRDRVGSVLRKLTHNVAMPVSTIPPDEADVAEPIVEEATLAENASVDADTVDAIKPDTTAAMSDDHSRNA